MTATVIGVTDSVTPVAVIVIWSQLSPLSRSFRNSVTVCGVMVSLWCGAGLLTGVLWCDGCGLVYRDCCGLVYRDGCAVMWWLRRQL